MPDIFEEIKPVQWPLAFLTYLLRNVQFVLGCVIFCQTCWYGSKKFLGVLKLCQGQYYISFLLFQVLNIFNCLLWNRRLEFAFSLLFVSFLFIVSTYWVWLI